MHIRDWLYMEHGSPSALLESLHHRALAIWQLIVEMVQRRADEFVFDSQKRFHSVKLRNETMAQETSNEGSSHQHNEARHNFFFHQICFAHLHNNCARIQRVIKRKSKWPEVNGGYKNVDGKFSNWIALNKIWVPNERMQGKSRQKPYWEHPLICSRQFPVTIMEQTAKKEKTRITKFPRPLNWGKRLNIDYTWRCTSVYNWI